MGESGAKLLEDSIFFICLSLCLVIIGVASSSWQSPRFGKTLKLATDVFVFPGGETFASSSPDKV